MADTSVPSASAPRSSLHNNAPGSRESLVEPPSPALSSSSRTHSIRRKPVPQAPNPIDTSRETTPYAEGNETLASSNEQQDAPRNGMLSSGVLSLPGQGTPLHELPPSPSNSHLHAFPPQPRNGTATPSPTLPAAASAAPFSYHSSAPLAMSAAARAPSSIASHDLPPPETNPAAFRSGLNSRPSVHSHRSSVAAESIYGTAQVGVIGKNKPREVIRIERDYSGGELCQFWSGWIWELEGRITPTEFQNTLNELNAVLASAHDPYKSCFDNCLAIVTLYISPQILGSHYIREMRKFERILDRANREIYNPVGLNLLSPRRNAFLFLEIEYY